MQGRQRKVEAGFWNVKVYGLYDVLLELVWFAGIGRLGLYC